MGTNARQHLQILGSIVRSVMVYVMHDLAQYESAAYCLFRNKTVFVDVPTTVDARAVVVGWRDHANVSCAVDEPAAVPSSAAFSGMQTHAALADPRAMCGAPLERCVGISTKNLITALTESLRERQPYSRASLTRDRILRFVANANITRTAHITAYDRPLLAAADARGYTPIRHMLSLLAERFVRGLIL